MDISISYKSKWIIPDLIISYLIFICPIVLFTSPYSSRIESCVIAMTSAFLAICYFGIRSKSLFGFSIVFTLLIGFLTKVLIGYIFWEYYMFPNYFSDPESQFNFDHFEYLLTNEWMKEMAEARIRDGIVNIPTYMWFYKNSFIHLFMSNLFISGSYNPYDISIQNGLFSIFTSLVIMQMTKVLGGNLKQQRWALILAIYQPFSIIDTIIFRDIVGQFFVSLGGLLLMLSTTKRALTALFLIIFASLTMFLQRYIYIILPIAVTAFNFLMDSKNRYKLFLLPLLIFALVSFNSFFSIFESVSKGYSGEISGLKLYLLLPLNIIRLQLYF